jgi:hypothetical protein
MGAPATKTPAEPSLLTTLWWWRSTDSEPAMPVQAAHLSTSARVHRSGVSHEVAGSRDVHPKEATPMETTRLTIAVVKHRTTDLLLRVCAEMPGLHVSGGSLNDITKALESRVRDLIEADGSKVIGVAAQTYPLPGSTDFDTPVALISADVRVAEPRAA